MFDRGTVHELEYSLKEVHRSLKRSCVFPNLTLKLVALTSYLRDDLEKNPDWYKDNQKLCFQLLDLSQKLLLFTRKNLVVDSTRRVELILLRKGRILLELNLIKSFLLSFWSRFEDLFFSTSLGDKMDSELFTMFSKTSFKESLNLDFLNSVKLFLDVFARIMDGFPKHDISILASSVREKMPKTSRDVAEFELFDDPLFQRASFSFSEYLLKIDPQKERLLSKANLLHWPSPLPQLKGTFGEIFVGSLKMKDKSLSDRLSLQLIPESTLLKCSSFSRANLASELGLMIGAPHPALLRIKGYTLFKTDFFVAFDPIDRNLAQYLHGSHEWKVAHSVLNNSQITSVISCVSRAVSHLHSLGIVHGDLKPENVFLGSDGGPDTCIAKVANFSYGLDMSEKKNVMTMTDYRYTAPEVLDGRKHSTASDVYSLAIIFWEICQENKTPFHHLTKNGEELIQKIINQERPRLNGNEPEFAKALMKMSWANERWTRPTSRSWKEVFESMIISQQIDVQKADEEMNNLMRRMSAHTLNIKRTSIARPQDYNYNRKQEEDRFSMASFTSGVSNKSHLNHFNTDSHIKLRAMSVETITALQNRNESDSVIGSECPDGYSKGQIKDLLTEFYTENDPSKLDSNFDTLVKYCLTNGLKEFNKNLKRDYKKGIRKLEVSLNSALSHNVNEQTMPELKKKPRGRNANSLFFFPISSKKREKKKKSEKTTVDESTGPPRNHSGSFTSRLPTIGRKMKGKI